MGDTLPTLASSYHEGYMDGIKIALEFIELAHTKEAAAESLSNMLETLNKQETN